MQINKEPEYEKKSMKKNQKDWIDYFNSIGQKMISAPDIYRVAKEENKGLMESLRKDFKEIRVITSTKIVYKKDGLNAQIVHDANSQVVSPKKFTVKIPVYVGQAREDLDTEKYLQVLFDTKDKVSNILKILNRFDKSRKIYLYTPPQSQRADKQVRSVDFGFVDFDRFNVDGYSWFGDYDGVSRGVTVSSAKQTKKRGATR